LFVLLFCSVLSFYLYFVPSSLQLPPIHEHYFTHGAAMLLQSSINLSQTSSARAYSFPLSPTRASPAFTTIKPNSASCNHQFHHHFTITTTPIHHFLQLPKAAATAA
jgi:hypothetical protein